MSYGPSELTDADQLELMLIGERHPDLDLTDLIKFALSVRRGGWDDGVAARGPCWEDFA